MEIRIKISPSELGNLIDMLQHPNKPEIYNKIITNMIRGKLPYSIIKIMNLASEFCDKHLLELSAQYFRDRYEPTDKQAENWYTSVRSIKTNWSLFLRKKRMNISNQTFTPDDLIEYIQERYNVTIEKNGRIHGLCIQK